MNTASPTQPGDLTGTADERLKQLKELVQRSAGSLPAEWFRRQLEGALVAWGEDETKLDINKEARIDY